MHTARNTPGWILVPALVALLIWQTLDTEAAFAATMIFQPPEADASVIDDSGSMDWEILDHIAHCLMEPASH